MAKDYQYWFSQLRRIEDHREAQAVKEIRKIYRDILKETRHFIADEYAALAEDGRLTYEILRSKGQDARFLQEVEQRLGDMSIDVSRQIKKTVEEMYQLSFDGLREAVEKSSDVAEFREIFAGVDRSKAQQLWATVDNTIMDIALEKNHKNIVWDIKREIATALTVGDRYDTMADRLAKSLDGNYKKATLIARTEVHRVREAAHSASAKELNETLKQGGSGLRYVKKWKTMKDGAVRPNVRYKTKKGWKSGKSRPGAPNHVKMHNVVVLEEELFDLGGGVKTDAPGQSGVAGHDCNCRCQCLHLLMDDEEFFQATGRHFDGTAGLQTPGNDGEKAVPYSERGIDIEPRVQEYAEKLTKPGDYISDKAGAFRNQDLAVLTTETGVEYTTLTIGDMSYLIRGEEGGTTIPKALMDEILAKRGTLDCHSHPFIGDLTPSESDENFLRLLTWQKESLIIDPTQKAAKFTADGVAELFSIESAHDAEYYSSLFGGGDD